MDRPRKKTKSQVSPEVIAAVKVNDVSTLRSLKESGESLGLCNSLNENLLHIAILEYYSKSVQTIEVFQYLVTLDEIDIHAIDRRGFSPLRCAFVFASENQNYAFKLIEAGCDLSMVGPHGNSLLHWAAQWNWTEVIGLLLEKGADIAGRNDMRQTALHVAAEWGHTDSIWKLLYYGADPNMTWDNTTFFDMIYKNEALLNQFSNFEKNFSLSTFNTAMKGRSDVFYKLMYIVCDINYDRTSLTWFIKDLHLLDSKMLKIFVTEYGYNLDEAFQSYSLFKGIPFSPTTLQNFCENILILLDSNNVSLVSILVDEMNNGYALPSLIQHFGNSKGHLELLTQVICCLLSHGLNMTFEAMDELYLSFGYSDLFKIALHMDITPGERPNCVWPTVIYDVQMDFEKAAYHTEYDADDGELYDLAEYFTRPPTHNARVPPLVELARNASRKYIITTYQAKNCMQFYTVLKRLPIAEVHKKIISFEKKLHFLNQ